MCPNQYLWGFWKIICALQHDWSTLAFFQWICPFSYLHFSCPLFHQRQGLNRQKASMLSLTFRKKFLRNKLGYCIIQSTAQVGCKLFSPCYHLKLEFKESSEEFFFFNFFNEYTGPDMSSLQLLGISRIKEKQ